MPPDVRLRYPREMQPEPPGFNPYAAPVALLPVTPGVPPGQGRLSIDGAFGRAFETMKRFLFRPFDFGKWSVYGFMCWLAEMGEGGTSLPTNNLNWPGGGDGAAPVPRRTSATCSPGSRTTRRR